MCIRKKLFRTLLRFAFATLWNRSNRFIDSADDLYDGDDERHGGSVGRPVNEDDVEKACEDTSDATRMRAVWKFIIVECRWVYYLFMCLIFPYAGFGCHGWSMT